MTDVASDSTLRFAVLGRVRVWRDDMEVDLGSRQQRQLLALLLLRAGGPVDVDEIVEALWDDRAPASATNLVHRYVGGLRRLFEPNLASRSSGRWLTRTAAAYRMNVDDGSLDLLRFRRLANEASAAVEQGEPAGALDICRQALDLSQGPCAVGLGDTITNSPSAIAVSQELHGMLCLAARAARDTGRGEEVLPMVSTVAADNPFDERIQSQLLLLLASAGRQADAVRAYHSIRKGLSDELGIDPGPELRAAYQMVLGQRACFATVATSAEDTHDMSVLSAHTRPDQLPAELAVFAGREDEISTLDSFLDDDSGRVRTLLVVIDGMPGTGKTTLAVRWAHDVADRFPDGSLYVNLRGFSQRKEQLPVTEVLRGFLSALGVSSEHIPDSETAQSGLFRSVLSGKRMVILLDNARDAAQVRPLLPGRSGCLVIVTSRNRLSGLVAQDGAHLLTLNSLTPHDSLTALRKRLGSDRIAAELGAASRITELCAHLPLAISLVAARATAHPQFNLSAIADKIVDADNLLDFAGDTDVESVFSWSYRLLTPTAARLFRLFSLVPGADLSREAAASLLGTSMRDTQAALNELTQSSMFGEHMPGRYSTHDLVLAYARILTMAQDSDEERRLAVRRVLDFYLHAAYSAHKALGPNQTWSAPPPAEHDVVVQIEDRRPAAMVWFLHEHRVLAQAVRLAFETGLLEHAWRIALTMHQFYQRHGLWHEWETLMRLALEAAELSADRAGEADVTRSLAGACHFLRRYEESLAYLRRTAALYTELGYSAQRAYLECNFGMLSSSMGDYQAAIDHFVTAMTLYQEQAHRAGEANSAYGIARAHSLLRNPAEAIEWCHRAMHLFQEIDDSTSAGNCWSTLGVSYHLLREYDKAIDSYQRAIDLYRIRGNGNRPEEAKTLERLAEAYLDAGFPDAALSALRASLTLHDDLNAPHAEDVRLRIGAVARIVSQS